MTVQSKAAFLMSGVTEHYRPDVAKAEIVEDTQVSEAAKFTKTEDNFIRQFGKKGDVIDVKFYKGSSQGSRQKGERDYKIAKKLAKDGILKVIDSRVDTYVNTLTVELLIDPPSDLTLKEKALLNDIKAWIESGKAWQYGRDWRQNPDDTRMLAKRESDLFDGLKRKGYVGGDDRKPILLKDSW